MFAACTMHLDSIILNIVRALTEYFSSKRGFLGWVIVEHKKNNICFSINISELVKISDFVMFVRQIWASHLWITTKVCYNYCSIRLTYWSESVIFKERPSAFS